MKSIRTNLVSLTLGQGVSFAINFVSILLAARSLGVNEFGEFASLLAIVTMMSKIVDFGVSPIIFRELSKENARPNIFYSVVTLRTILAVLVFIIYNVSVFFLGLSHKEILLSDILFLTIVVSSRMANFREVLSTPFKVALRMHIPMLINILDSTLLLIYIIIMSIHGLGFNEFILGYVFSNIPGFIFLLYYLGKEYNYKLRLQFAGIKWLILESLPLAGYVILMVIYQQADIVLLKSINGTYYTGIYSASMRLTMPLNIIPATIVTSVFPLIVKYREEKKQSNSKIAIIFKILFFISFIFAITFSFKSTSLVKVSFGREYLNAAVPAILLFWSQVFLFFSFFGTDLLTAYDSQKWNFVYASLVVVINIAMDFILLPDFNFVGAGISKLFSSFLGALLLYFILKKNKISFFRGKMKIIFSLTFTVIIFYFLSFLPLMIYLILVLGCIYILLRYHLFFSYNEVIEVGKTLSLQKWVYKFFYSKA